MSFPRQKMEICPRKSVEMHSKCLEIYGKMGFINIIFLIHFYIKYIVYKIHHYTVIIIILSLFVIILKFHM